MQEKLQGIHEAGQSIWYDNIRRSLLRSGELESLIGDGIRGVTSNPSIFQKAIAGSTDYDEALSALAAKGLDFEAIFERLAFGDVRETADLLRSIYEESEGVDGYVSFEVAPDLADETQATVEEARRLHRELDRPNVMIKVPATEAGVPAIRQLIGDGICVNVTLIFSLERYEEVVEAYLAGLENLLEMGGDPGTVASVASFFVSRVDVKVDPLLDQRGADHLRGQIAIANAKLAYRRFHELFSGDRWERLAEAGARVQRPLWASTSVKDPHYQDTKYVDALIGPQTINTVPPATLRALMDHGSVESVLGDGLERAEEHLLELEALEVDLDQVTDELAQEGVEAFADAYEELLSGLREKAADLQAKRRWFQIEAGGLGAKVQAALAEIEEKDILARIWAHDHTVWAEGPDEITNRLGWLEIPEKMMSEARHLRDFAGSLRQEGFRRAVLLGMGGSSLAPEVFSDVFGPEEEGLALQVLDSTDPQAITAVRAAVDLEETLFIVATKSGSTVETLSLFKYFFNQVTGAVGEGRAGDHFVAITDPGTNLVRLGEARDFREIFLNDPNLGGRYSALSHFGLVPAGLVGVDLEQLLERALEARCACETCVPCGENPAAQIGAMISAAALAGRDKLTFLISPAVAPFGDWVEQLLAESTGKSGVGIVPIVREPLGEEATYSPDRAFVHLRIDGDSTHDERGSELAAAGYPVLRLRMRDRYDLSAQMFQWELATAVAGHRLGIHPFNQPNVEAAKIRAREMVKSFQQSGELPAEAPILKHEGIKAYWGGPEAGHGQDPPTADTLSELMAGFLERAQPGSYLSLQAYLTPSEPMTQRLRSLQAQLRDRSGLAVTMGFGPRFLHSTGQLHKGDAGLGLFLQLTDQPSPDVPIPDEAGDPKSSISFGTLKLAQALGDRQALTDAGRTVMRLDLGNSPVLALDRLLRFLRE